MRHSHPALVDPEFYVPGLPADYVAARYGISAADIAKLGSAENPLGASAGPWAVQAIREQLDDLHLYPSWTAEPLREKISLVYGIEPERVMCGAGETEIISWLIRAFCEPGGRIQMPGPCFPIYHLFAEAEDRVPVLVHGATDRATMAVDVDAYIDAIGEDTRIVFVTNPHSPSGTWMIERDVRRIVEAAPSALVVLRPRPTCTTRTLVDTSTWSTITRIWWCCARSPRRSASRAYGSVSGWGRSPWSTRALR